MSEVDVVSAAETDTPVGRRRFAVGSRAKRQALVGWAQQNGMFFALLLMGVFFALRSENFLTGDNLRVIAIQSATVALVALPGALLVLSGYVDLSVGSLMVLATAVFGQAFEAGWPIGAAVMLGLAAAALWGALNGLFIAGLGFSPIIVTLGGLAAARGMAEVITHGRTVSKFGDAFRVLGTGSFLTLRTPVWLALIAIAAAWYVWSVGPWGRHMAAIGADETAARALGIATRKLPSILYVVSGLAAGLAGLIFASRLDGASLTIGQGQELVVLSAILLGGVSFTGGRGTLLGVLSGVLFLAALQNGLILIGVGVFFQNVALGGALFFAAALDVLYRRLERLPIGTDDSTATSEQVSDD